MWIINPFSLRGYFGNMKIQNSKTEYRFSLRFQSKGICDERLPKLRGQAGNRA